MKVFKFGGASVKDADSVKNVSEVLKIAGCENCFLVISAMGKTTNHLEEVVEAYFKNENYAEKIETIQKNHLEISHTLFEENNPIFTEIELFFSDIIAFLRRNKSPNYNYVYDQIVGCGELISTKIVNAYLQSTGLNSKWLDIRDYIKTDSTYREGKVDWKITEQNFKKLELNSIYVSQGFLGSDNNYMTVTLGREGSDYTAAIVAYSLDAESVTIWKDVPGVLNADPRYFKDTQLLKLISYREAVELAYYGASVIHPKTLKPLENKEIPFYIKSFLNPKEEGTIVKKGQKLEPLIPCYIQKKNQILVEISSKDFSFMAEEHLGEIFEKLAELSIKVSLIQTSALCLSLCLEDKFNNINTFVEELQNTYNFEIINNVTLYTVRHFDKKAQLKVTEGKNVLLEQIIKENLQIVIQE